MIDKPDMDRDGRNAGRQMRLRAPRREKHKPRKTQNRDPAHRTAAGTCDVPKQRRSAEDPTE
jgi:hypothetical protein